MCFVCLRLAKFCLWTWLCFSLSSSGSLPVLVTVLASSFTKRNLLSDDDRGCLLRLRGAIAQRVDHLPMTLAGSLKAGKADCAQEPTKMLT